MSDVVRVQSERYIQDIPQDLYRHGMLRTLKAWRQRKERYRLVGTRCRACGTLWGRAAGCAAVAPRATSRSTRSDRNGRVQSVVKLPEGVYVGPTDVVDCPLGGFHDGMRVRRVLRKIRREQNGNWQFACMWVPEADL